MEDKVLFDTGMTGLYNLSRNKLLEFEQNNSVVKDNMNSPLIAKISIAQATFKNTPVIVSNTANSRIGMDLLKYGNVTLNFKNKKMYFDPFDQEIDLVNKAENKAEDTHMDGNKATSTCM
ncbi:MAG: hypothetical protein L3J83_01375 [Proteobacteria bacterium]|nr:hypothetical protein [Pseudomonadota bacterium]